MMKKKVYLPKNQKQVSETQRSEKHLEAPNSNQPKDTSKFVFKGCSHIKKLKKAEVSMCVSFPSQISCEFHKSKVESPTLCLHCNLIYCGPNTKELCILSHQKMNEGHIFSVPLCLKSPSFSLFCAECSADLWNFWCDNRENFQSEELSSVQEILRMKRFIEFVKKAYSDIREHHLREEQFEKQSIRVSGLSNLGNTCFLNSGLQVLSHCPAILQLYREFNFNKGQFGAKSMGHPRKALPKEIEFFYDEVIEEGESKTWHIVGSGKESRYKNSEKMLKTVTSCQFNVLFQEFLRLKAESEFDFDGSILFEPIEILEFLGKVDSKYLFKEEQDAQEAVMLIVDILVQGEFVGLGYDSERYAEVERHIGRQKIAPLQRILGTYLLSQVYCAQCRKVNFTLDLTYEISVNIQSTSRKEFQFSAEHMQVARESIQKFKYHRELRYPEGAAEKFTALHPLLARFFQEETLTKRSNYYECPECRSLSALKRFFLVEPPQVLIVSLKRFNHKLVKNSSFVEFPENLDLRQVCLITAEQEEQATGYFASKRAEQSSFDDSSTKYELFGMIVHIGSTINSGHYISYVKKEGFWFRCSDNQISRSSWSEVKNSEAYMLFYQKQSNNMKLMISKAF